jgi:hypothetical protein
MYSIAPVNSFTVNRFYEGEYSIAANDDIFCICAKLQQVLNAAYVNWTLSQVSRCCYNSLEFSIEIRIFLLVALVLAIKTDLCFFDWHD